MSDIKVGSEEYKRLMNRGHELMSTPLNEIEVMPTHELNERRAELLYINAQLRVAEQAGRSDTQLVAEIAARPLDDADRESAIAGLVDDYDEVMQRWAGSLGTGVEA